MIPFEDDRNDVYLDSRGKPTVGIGHLIKHGDNLKAGDRISDARKEALWREDSARALETTQKQMKEAGITDPNFILPLAAVNFQLGGGWRAEFKKTWTFMKNGEYEAAAREAQDSTWYNQTPKRVRAFQNALRALPPKPSPNIPAG
ncbi:MAG: glycoside hydrolase family protein [Sphingomonas sp.]|uniref:glycoside hydrolase family protein n=1 Tax=Sphingomonas sp. TaxID=28214 RepID=UPI00185E987F|nr:glycoside hydrolase family protein [Sphingomonas sp.]MBA3667910.1 glycoside hydrolase family protein [Sphingomonas sp.]